ncbi:MAG: CotH kinase family protein [Bacteroidales bacterium]|nr:CotH kinase family protein [Bacteroidales bacterium]
MKLRTLVFILLIFVGSVYNTNGQDSILISEFMALNNNTLQDEDGNFEDWIEINNAGSVEVNLAGWSLTDEATIYTKWLFPDITLAPGEYLIVFASGKDRKVEKNKLHTNFKLSGSGEFLGLGKPGSNLFISSFVPSFPVQYPDVSYGMVKDVFTWLSVPSPGAENMDSTYLPPPVFSVEHGFFDAPFNLKLSTGLEDAEIYFTTDASTPSKESGQKYTEPINIVTTTVVRAIAVKEGTGSGITKSQTYIFPEDVLSQPSNPAGYPETWLSPIHGTNDYFEIAGNYNMKSEFVNRTDVKTVIIESLKSLPVMSIVSDIDNFFSKSMHPDSGGIYMYNGEPDGPTRDLKYHLGRGWIRPGSVEYFNSDVTDGSLNYQANCGLKIHGGASRTRAKTEKHSFKIGFKSEYGPSKLKEQVFGKESPKQYDWLILRGGFAPRLGLQIRDPWAKATFSEMGQYAAKNKFVHVYLNGLYWGMYNLSEQMDDNCMRDNLGASADDYDILKDYFEIEAGDTIAWTKLVEMAGDNIENDENYQKLLGNNADGSPNAAYEKLLNAENLVDYIMMNFYAGTTDWDHHNWVAARRKTNSEGFYFIPWDCESVLGSVTYNRTFTVGQENRPSGIFSDLMKNSSFKNLFISHVNKHFFEGGALTPNPGLARYQNLFASIDTALIADQARWVYNSNDIWNSGYHSFIYNYFPRRSEIVFNQLINAGMYPEIEAPVFNTADSRIPEDFQLMMSAPDGGEIRYSLNGADPGHFSMAVNKSIMVYDNKALPLLSDTLNILARVKKDTLWSRLVTKQFIVGNHTGLTNELSLSGTMHLYCYPNPVKDMARLVFSLTETSDINLSIYSVTGELIAQLENGVRPAGCYTINQDVGNIPSGLYICVLENRVTFEILRIKIIKE